MTRHWLDQQERSTAWALRLIMGIALKLGRGPARALLYPITAYFLAFSPASRRHSRRFLHRVQGQPPGLLQVARHLFTFASVILDRVFLLSGRENLLDVSVEHTELLDERLESKRGCLLVGAHFGSFEVLRALAVTRAGLDVRVLMHRRHNRRLTEILDRLNDQVATTVIDIEDPLVLLRVQEALDAGALVGILADRDAAGRDAVRCPFLGRCAPFPSGPMRLAAVLGVPVVQFFGIYDGGNRYRIRFEPLAQGGKPARGERERWVNAMTHRFAGNLERNVRTRPYNWFNFYDFWEPARPGAAE